MRSLLALLAATLVAPAVVAAPPAARAYTFRIWDPGYLPGDYWGRRTLALRVQGDAARLAITTERPPADQRGRANATGFKRHGDETVLDGTVQRDGAGLTLRFGDVVLTCVDATVPVHAARATVEVGCSSCYDECGDKPTAIWKPAKTRRQKALVCKPTSGDLPGLRGDIEEIPFGTAPGIEYLVGPTDCPATGLRAAS